MSLCLESICCIEESARSKKRSVINLTTALSKLSKTNFNDYVTSKLGVDRAFWNHLYFVPA